MIDKFLSWYFDGNFKYYFLVWAIGLIMGKCL